MNAYHIGLPLKETVTGHTYTALPSHCTLMPWFHSEATEAEVVELVRGVCQTKQPFILTSEQPALYGKNNTIPVHTVTKTSALHDLHMDLYQKLAGLGVQFTEPEHAGENYGPHVTDYSEPFVTGSKHQADIVYVTQALKPDTIEDKKILTSIKLS